MTKRKTFIAWNILSSTSWTSGSRPISASFTSHTRLKRSKNLLGSFGRGRPTSRPRSWARVRSRRARASRVRRSCPGSSRQANILNETSHDQGRTSEKSFRTCTFPILNQSFCLCVNEILVNEYFFKRAASCWRRTMILFYVRTILYLFTVWSLTTFGAS